ncbi:MAG: twitching motility protein PilT [Lachnospiraceae bacterium]
MIQIIAGEKGKGKTKILIDKANADVLTAKGSIVYLDKSNKHMYELSNKIRLINVKDYFVEDGKEFLGFISGLVSQDHDLSTVYLDGFLNITGIELADLPDFLKKLEQISGAFEVDFIISLSAAPSSLPESVTSYVSVAL